MSTKAITGKDTIIINGRILNNFGKGDVAKITYPEDKWNVAVGKDGNSIFSFKYAGLKCEVELLVLRSSDDDKFLNSLDITAVNNPAAFSLITGEFIKNTGDGAGNVSQEIYLLSGGVIRKGVEAKENTDGEEGQSMSQYFLTFASSGRTNN